MGSVVRGSQSANKSQPGFAESSVCDRIAFAPWIRATGLLICPPEKMGATMAHRVQWNTFSGPVSERESQNCGVFKRFSEECRPDSLHLRLNGGEGGIRTLGTGVSPYNGLANESFSPPSLVFNHLPSCRSFSVGPRDPHSALTVLRFVLQICPLRRHLQNPAPPNGFHNLKKLHCHGCYGSPTRLSSSWWRMAKLAPPVQITADELVPVAAKTSATSCSAISTNAWTTTGSN